MVITNKKNIKSRLIFGKIGDYLSLDDIQKRIVKAKEHNISVLGPMILLKIRRVQKTNKIRLEKNKETNLDEMNREDKKFVRTLKEIETFF